MPKFHLPLFMVFFIFVCTLAPGIASAEDAKPIRAEEVLALIAGNALSKDIVHAISQNGLAFTPDDSYRALLKTIGADESIVAALNGATSAAGGAAETMPERAVLQHYVDASLKMKSKDFKGASQEMAAALKDSFDSVDTGFVMAEAFRLQKRYAESEAIYEQLLATNPDFPELHAKLSYIEIKMEDQEGGLREAKAALAAYKDDAEGHKNACLSLEGLHEFDAAEIECREALRLWPDYQSAHVDMGLVFRDQNKSDQAIAEFKRAVALDATDALGLYDLGLAYSDIRQYSEAIPYYQKAIEADPTWFYPRENLASALFNSGRYPEGIDVMRQMEKMYPDSEICHLCMGGALYNTGDLQGAAREYQEASRLDPSDADPHDRLALVWLQQKKYDEALTEASKAEQIDPSDANAHKAAARSLFMKNEFEKAAAEDEQAEKLMPSDAEAHDLRGQALLNLHKTSAAIEEFKQSAALDPHQVPVAIRLAEAYEDINDWADAIDQYRRTALAEAGVDIRMSQWRGSEFDPEREYEAAQKRLNDHIAALKAAGKASEATALQAQIAGMQKSASASDKLNTLMQAGVQAYQQQKFEDGFEDFKQAVDIARQIQPPDPRLPTALEYLGNGYLGRDFAAADATFNEELKAAQQIYGPRSAAVEIPMESLGNSALLQKNYAAAEKYYFQVVDLTTQIYGESNDQVAMKLVSATRVFMVQQQYDKAEPYLLRAEHIMESTYGDDSDALEYPLASLCYIYDKWPKPDKAEGCYAHYLRVVEKQFGANSPKIIPVLTAQAAAQRAVGHNDDAEKSEKRAAELRSATMASN
jgi:tetratricopeptide (TPR) repeat protein